MLNPYTKALNCPKGYDAVQIAKFYGTSQFVCIKHGVKSDPLHFFGGMYQVSDCRNNFVNPLTGATNCPAGHTNMVFEVSIVNGPACVYPWDYRHPAHVHWCYNATTGLKNAIIGGFYNNYGANNPWTGTVSCPYGFTSYRIQGTAANGNSYVCLSNVYST